MAVAHLALSHLTPAGLEAVAPVRTAVAPVETAVAPLQTAVARVQTAVAPVQTALKWLVVSLLVKDPVQGVFLVPPLPPPVLPPVPPPVISPVPPPVPPRPVGINPA